MFLELGETTFEKVLILRNVLEARATHSSDSDDAARYDALRRELLADAALKERLPKFLRTCFKLDDFWGFIKREYSSYQERREYLAAEFAPRLPTSSPALPLPKQRFRKA